MRALLPFAFVLASGCVAPQPEFSSSSGSDGAAAFRTAFNAARGTPRFVAVLSPT